MSNAQNVEWKMDRTVQCDCVHCMYTHTVDQLQYCRFIMFSFKPFYCTVHFPFDSTFKFLHMYRNIVRIFCVPDRNIPWFKQEWFRRLPAEHFFSMAGKLHLVGLDIFFQRDLQTIQIFMAVEKVAWTKISQQLPSHTVKQNERKGGGGNKQLPVNMIFCL